MKRTHHWKNKLSTLRSISVTQMSPPDHPCCMYNNRNLELWYCRINSIPVSKYHNNQYSWLYLCTTWTARMYYRDFPVLSGSCCTITPRVCVCLKGDTGLLLKYVTYVVYSANLQRMPSNKLCLFPIEPCFNQRIVPIPSVQGLTVWQKHKLHCMNIIRNICWWQLLNKCVDFIALHTENRKQLWFPSDNDLNVSL